MILAWLATTMVMMRGVNVPNDQDMMRIADVAAELGTCSRLRVGAVLVKDGCSLTTGWNGVAAGMPPCEHTRSTLPCQAATHAEVRAIGSAAYFDRSTRGATMYVTHSPCLSCAQLIVLVGIATVVYRDEYRKLDGLEYLSASGVEVRRV